MLARRRFLQFLEKECKENNSTVVYATHIFDGLEDFPTHLVLLEQGKLIEVHKYEELKKSDSYKSLYFFVVRFLEKMMEKRGTSKPKKPENDNHYSSNRFMSHFT